MYNSVLPEVTSKLSTAGLNVTFQNNNDLMKDLYIEDMYDPDRLDLDPNKQYVVPRENQLIYDVPNQMIYRCTYVDYEATLKPTLKPWSNIAGDTSETDSELEDLYGLVKLLNGERTINIDYSVVPNRARIDGRIISPGAAYGKLYKGVTIGDTGQLISCTYDNSNLIQTDRVPVVLAEIKDSTNIMIMTTEKFSVTENAESLPIGSMCTLVFYDKENCMIPPAYPLVVQHGSFLKDNNISKKYVTEIELVVPWFTNSDEPEIVNIPVNVILDTLEFRARVYYSDGSKSGPLPINGSDFTLLGIDHYQPTSVGNQMEMVLMYKLKDDEEIYLATPSSPRTKTRVYNFRSVDTQGAFSPKIYTIPYSNGGNGYDLKHYLYDLDRNFVFDVTDVVQLNQVSEAYNPTKYGSIQSLIFNLRLSDASPSYLPYIYKQNVDITLYRNPTLEGNKFAVSYDGNVTTQVALPAVQRRINGLPYLNFSGGNTNLETWLQLVYFNGLPVYDPLKEEKPITPNMFEIFFIEGETRRFSIDAWNTDNLIGTTKVKPQTVFMKFLKVYDDGSELQLGMGMFYLE